jgi:hypothetical protein
MEKLATRSPWRCSLQQPELAPTGDFQGRRDEVTVSGKNDRLANILLARQPNFVIAVLLGKGLTPLESREVIALHSLSFFDQHDLVRRKIPEFVLLAAGPTNLEEVDVVVLA